MNNSKKIGTFKPKLNFKNLFWYFFMFLIFMPSGLAVVAQGLSQAQKPMENPHEILYALGVLGILFPVFFYIFIFKAGNNNKISIFEGGIELYIPNLGKRKLILWEAIDSFNLEDDLLQKQIFIHFKESNEYGIINIPLTNMKYFASLLKKFLPKEHCLVCMIESQI